MSELCCDTNVIARNTYQVSSELCCDTNAIARNTYQVSSELCCDTNVIVRNTYQVNGNLCCDTNAIVRSTYQSYGLLGADTNVVVTLKYVPQLLACDTNVIVKLSYTPPVPPWAPIVEAWERFKAGLSWLGSLLYNFLLGAWNILIMLINVTITIMTLYFLIEFVKFLRETKIR